MSGHYFVTTPIYYANAEPHIGHTYTTVLVDTLLRWHRARGAETWSVSGTDEHGEKMVEAAAKLGVAPGVFTERISAVHQRTWAELGLSASRFVRTTGADHRRSVSELFRRIEARGDVYLGDYEDWYCTPCETFWPESQLLEGNCPDCHRPTERLKEPSDFFRMSRHQEALLPGMHAAIRKHRPKLIFLSTPNNPTGNCFSADRIRVIVERSSAVVVVDEAYQPFSRGKGFVPFRGRYPNLVILRTVSKIGLAALRLSFLIASPEIVSQVNKVRLPFNVNSLSQAVAAEALADRTMLGTAVSSIVRERKKLFDALRRIPGAEPFPTDANFILFKVKDAKTVHRGLLRQGVLVRDVSDAVSGWPHPQTANRKVGHDLARNGIPH